MDDSPLNLHHKIENKEGKTLVLCFIIVHEVSQA